MVSRCTVARRIAVGLGLAGACVVLAGFPSVVGAAPPPETTVPGAATTADPAAPPPTDTVPSTSTTIEATGEDTGLGPDVTVVFQTPPLITDQQVASGPLVVVPVGCPTVPPPTAVFVGTIELMDFRTAQFVVEQVRAGTLDNWAVDGHVQVRYGEDTRWLEVGDTYIVGAANDPTTGVLTSKVREPDRLFGGNAVIGADDDGLQCPTPEDPVRTLTESGSTVESGLLTPLKDAKGDLLMAVLRPLGIAFAVLIALVLIKQLMFATGRALRSNTATEQYPLGPPERPRSTHAVRRQHRVVRRQRRVAEAEIREHALAARTAHHVHPMGDEADGTATGEGDPVGSGRQQPLP